MINGKRNQSLHFSLDEIKEENNQVVNNAMWVSLESRNMTEVKKREGGGREPQPCSRVQCLSSTCFPSSSFVKITMRILRESWTSFSAPAIRGGKKRSRQKKRDFTLRPGGRTSSSRVKRYRAEHVHRHTLEGTT